MCLNSVFFLDFKVEKVVLSFAYAEGLTKRKREWGNGLFVFTSFVAFVAHAMKVS